MSDGIKSITPKHLLLTHPSNFSIQHSSSWLPFSKAWKRISLLGQHSPTWATALALSAILFSDGPNMRVSLGNDAQMTHSQRRARIDNSGSDFLLASSEEDEEESILEDK